MEDRNNENGIKAAKIYLIIIFIGGILFLLLAIAEADSDAEDYNDPDYSGHYHVSADSFEKETPVRYTEEVREESTAAFSYAGNAEKSTYDAAQQERKEDPYDVYEYDDPYDFYEDNSDDFDEYEDAEDYWDEAQEDE